MSNLLRLFPKVPMLLTSTFDYYNHGPPQPSWDLKFHLAIKFFQSMLKDIRPIEETQQSSFAPTRVIDDSVNVEELLLPNLLRKKSEIYIDGILKDYNHVLLDDWKSENIGNGLECEWVYVKEEERKKNHDKKKSYDRVILYLHGGAYLLCSTQFYRFITSKIAKFTNSRIFAINYRLAPQSQFPAALHDAITAYNYLINPPKDADFLPIDPKNIIIMGDSAGGGLTMATLLAIRDSKSLPLPAGAIVLSPWVDLTHSMPSVINTSNDKTDYMSIETFYFLSSPAWENFERKATELSEKIQLNLDNKPKFWHESLECENRLHLYASNEGTAIPYVSPLLAESLGDLPPILVQGGDGEKLRDEAIYLAFRASDPEKYKLTSYNDARFKNSPYKTPTKVILELYEEMPHVFLFMPNCASKTMAYKRISEFIDQSLSGEAKEKESTFLRVTAKGEIVEGLREDHYKILEWKNVGVKHDIIGKVCSAVSPKNDKSYINHFLYAILLVAVLVYMF